MLHEGDEPAMLVDLPAAFARPPHGHPMSDWRNLPIPGEGFLFTEDGMTLEEGAALAHEKGFISDDEMGIDGGVAALRRLLYSTVIQNRHHYARDEGRLTEEQKAVRRRGERLQREVVEYAEANGVNDPRYMDMFLRADDLERFGIEVTGKNLVDAELLAKLMQVSPSALANPKRAPSELSLRIEEMILWVRAGRPG